MIVDESLENNIKSVVLDWVQETGLVGGMPEDISEVVVWIKVRKWSGEQDEIKRSYDMNLWDPDPSFANNTR